MVLSQMSRGLLCAFLLAWALISSVVCGEQLRMQEIVHERKDLVATELATSLRGPGELIRSPRFSWLGPNGAKQPKHSQKGIVITTGNSKQLASAYITACVIRQLGCSLPIEIAVYGANEHPDAYHTKLLEVKSTS